MKNQYVADIGDYGKYGLLRFLQAQGIKLGVNWYFTPPDNRKDGRHLEYLEREAYREYDSVVYDEMRRIAFLPDKNINMVENSGILQAAVFYHAILDTDSLEVSMRTKARRKWHIKALQALRDVDLVFADPDNGLGINQRAGLKDSQRFILPDEVADYYSQGQDIFYYHHRDRKKSDSWMGQKTYMKRLLPDARLMAVAAHKWSMRAYIFVIHPSRADLYKKMIEDFLNTEWGSLKTGRTLFFRKEEA